MDGIQKFAFIEAEDQDENRHLVPIDDILDVADLGAGSGRCKIVRKSTGDQQSTNSYDTVLSRIDQRWDELRSALSDPKYRVVAYAAGSVYSLTATPAALTFGTDNPAVIIQQAGTYLLRARAVVLYNGATFAANRTLTLRYRRTNNIAGYLTNGATLLTTAIVTTHTGTFAVVELPEVVYSTFALDDNIAIYGDISVVPSAGSLDVVEAHIIAQRVE